ncbi:MAG TPA: hypothetical protein VFN11_04415 [Ktedonobacterales bacterium]|nr:hypothetical protein [Ktedonobacterales bacterium]
MTAAQFEGRWFQRADGMVFRMDDPDHIQRMLSEGWHEVDGPQTLTPVPVELPAESAAPPVAATVAAFTGQRSHDTTSAKPIKRVRVRNGERSN